MGNDDDDNNSNNMEHLWSYCYVPITIVIVSHMLTLVMLVSIWQASLCAWTQSWMASALNLMTWNSELQFGRVIRILENGISVTSLWQP